MNVIYYSTRGGITPQVAAAIHLRLLPRARLPTWIEWRRVPYRNGFPAQDRGRVLLLGRRGNHSIFVLPYSRRNGQLVVKVIKNVQALMDPGNNPFQLVDVGVVGSITPRWGFGLSGEASGFYQHLVKQVLRVERGFGG